jgi:hypothetical protein
VIYFQIIEFIDCRYEEIPNEYLTLGVLLMYNTTNSVLP